MKNPAQPTIVSEKEWNAARRELLRKEKEQLRAYDALSAERRRMPMMLVEQQFDFLGPGGSTDLVGLFEGRRQLIVYCAMLEPGAAPCEGCSMVLDNLGHNLHHLKARGTSFAVTSPAPQSEIAALKKRMEWSIPWYTDPGRKFADTYGTGKSFAVNVFFRDDENRVYRTYFTTDRGGEVFDTNLRLLDLTPYGRQEKWEDSPPGWPQGEPYVWWRMHDEYGEEKRDSCCERSVESGKA